MQASYWATTDTKLASVLATVGVKVRNPEPVTRVINKGKETCHYWFECDGANGIPTGQIADAFLQGQEACEALRGELPDLPGARASLFNRESFLDCIFNKCRPLVFVSLPNGGVMLADKHLSADTKRQVAELAL
jgi:hypothetical protein